MQDKGSAVGQYIDRIGCLETVLCYSSGLMTNMGG